MQSNDKSILKNVPVSENYFYVTFLIAESAVTFTHLPSV